MSSIAFVRAVRAGCVSISLPLMVALLASPLLSPRSSAVAAEATRPSAPPPASAFGTLPQVADVILSPNGALLAWVVDQGAKGRTVVVLDPATGATRRTFPLGATGKLRELVWHDDETLLATVSISHEVDRGNGEREMWEVFRTIAVALDGSEPKILLPEDSRVLVSGAQIVAHRISRPKTVLMARTDYSAVKENSTIDTRLDKGRRGSGLVRRLYAVDVRTGKASIVETGSPFTADWVVDRDGNVVARSDWEVKSGTFRLLANRGAGSWPEIYARTDGRSLDVLSLSDDGRSVLATGVGDDGLRKLYAIPLAGGAPQVLATDAEDDVYVMPDVFDGRPLRAGPGDDAKDRWLDPEAGKVYAKVWRAFPGRQVALESRSRDWNRVVVQVSSPTLPPTYYLVDFQKRSADIVGEAYPALADVPLGEMKRIDYAARDATQIPAFLTLPPGREPKNLPLVVLPHGGPAAHDSFEFDYIVQFLATRGYAVLQPQFRGSTGYGEAFKRAGYRQWGGLMQDDVTDGVKAMIAQGIADPARVCIAGISYGGFASLAGATLTPELYRCAVSINGVSDLPVMIAEVAKFSEKDDNGLNYWREHIGSPRDPQVVERSPARNAAKARAPILLIHGTGDSVVPLQQSELMALALQQAGKEYEFVRVDGEDHWLSTGTMRTRVLEELDRFLGMHLGR